MKENSGINKAKSFANEFKAMISKGNVVDMAVGVIIGGAFGKIVTSLVNDIIMPCISAITGGGGYASWKIVLKEAVLDAAGEVDHRRKRNNGGQLYIHRYRLPYHRSLHFPDDQGNRRRKGQAQAQEGRSPRRTQARRTRSRNRAGCT